jgi:hypothetical protein
MWQVLVWVCGILMDAILTWDCDRRVAAGRLLVLTVHLTLFLGESGKQLTKRDYWLRHVRPHGTARISPDGFAWKLVLGMFNEISWHIPVLVTVRKKQWALYMKTYVHYIMIASAFNMCLSEWGLAMLTSCHPFDLLPPRFCLLMVKVKQRTAVNFKKWCWSISSRWLQSAVMMGKISLCDKDVSQDSHVQKAEESSQRSHSLASQVCLQLSLSEVFAMFLLLVSGRSSSWKSFELWFWQNGMVSPCLWFVWSKWSSLPRASAFSFRVISQWLWYPK